MYFSISNILPAETVILLIVTVANAEARYIMTNMRPTLTIHSSGTPPILISFLENMKGVTAVITAITITMLSSVVKGIIVADMLLTMFKGVPAIPRPIDIPRINAIDHRLANLVCLENLKKSAKPSKSGMIFIHKP